MSEKQIPSEKQNLSLNPSPPDMELQWGVWWRKTDNQLMRHLKAFRLGPTEVPGGLGRAGHFKAISDMLWGATNKRKKFVFHPWAERMLEAACESMDTPMSFLAIAGAASTG